MSATGRGCLPHLCAHCRSGAWGGSPLASMSPPHPCTEQAARGQAKGGCRASAAQPPAASRARRRAGAMEAAIAAVTWPTAKAVGRLLCCRGGVWGSLGCGCQCLPFEDGEEPHRSGRHHGGQLSGPLACCRARLRVTLRWIWRLGGLRRCRPWGRRPVRRPLGSTGRRGAAPAGALALRCGGCCAISTGAPGRRPAVSVYHPPAAPVSSAVSGLRGGWVCDAVCAAGGSTGRLLTITPPSAGVVGCGEVFSGSRAGGTVGRNVPVVQPIAVKMSTPAAACPRR
jgi:hypothetical protein